MFAVFETGGKQYKVRVGDEIQVEKLLGQKDENVSFDRVLFCSRDGEMSIGKPYLDGGLVKGTIMQQGKGKKVVIRRHKQRKGYNRKIGHRQPFTTVKITEILAS